VTTSGRHLQRFRLALKLLQRFRLTLFFVALLFGVFPFFFVLLHPNHPTFLRALHHVYFLLFGQPTLEYAEDVSLEILNVLIPPLGLVTVVEGVVRFSFFVSARARDDKEWIQMVASTYQNHVVVCGAGRIGYRVTLQLQQLKKQVVVIERNGDAHFVSSLRELGVPVLIEDIRVRQSLQHANIETAAALVCATDDDLSNINTALEARKWNPSIRVVLRLFDDELADRIRDALGVEAQSASALAAPAFALSAIEPKILHSFFVDENLMVVARFDVRSQTSQLTLADIQSRYNTMTLSVRRKDGAQLFHPPGATTVHPGDAVVVQAKYDDYQRFREWCDAPVG
jgi:voltage-gated potassium channel